MSQQPTAVVKITLSEEDISQKLHHMLDSRYGAAVDGQAADFYQPTVATAEVKWRNGYVRRIAQAMASNDAMGLTIILCSDREHEVAKSLFWTLTGVSLICPFDEQERRLLEWGEISEQQLALIAATRDMGHALHEVERSGDTSDDCRMQAESFYATGFTGFDEAHDAECFINPGTGKKIPVQMYSRPTINALKAVVAFLVAKERLTQHKANEKFSTVAARASTLTANAVMHFL